MFLFEVANIFPELIDKARKAISHDELIVYLASCENEQEAFAFLDKFNWNNSIRTRTKPEIKITKINGEYCDGYNGFSEKTVYFTGIVDGIKTDGCITTHNHENGDIEYFMSWK